MDLDMDVGESDSFSSPSGKSSDKKRQMTSAFPTDKTTSATTASYTAQLPLKKQISSDYYTSPHKSSPSNSENLTTKESTHLSNSPHDNSSSTSVNDKEASMDITPDESPSSCSVCFQFIIDSPLSVFHSL